MTNSDALDGKIDFENSIGFLLRRALQRHNTLFSKYVGYDLTRAQTAVLAWLYSEGPCSQNLLGRHTGVDASTAKGVVDRLCARGLLEVAADPDDKRRKIVSLTDRGSQVLEEVFPTGRKVAEMTLAPLTIEERENLFILLRKIA
jgi:DNA-binding MarR family transcriptional regulator